MGNSLWLGATKHTRFGCWLFYGIFLIIGKEAAVRGPNKVERDLRHLSMTELVKNSNQLPIQWSNILDVDFTVNYVSNIILKSLNLEQSHEYKYC